MITILFNGFEFGIVLTFLVGPVFFAILQTSIERGFWSGALVAFGVSLSDIVYVIICYLGFSAFVANPSTTIFMGYAGGFILIGFGGYHLLVKTRTSRLHSPGAVTERNPLKFVVKGFAINVMSPMVPIFWIGAVSIATVDFGYTSMTEVALFFGGVLGTVLATDIVKAYLSGKLRELVTHRSLVIMNVLLGIGLVGFGARLLYLAIKTP